MNIFENLDQNLDFPKIWTKKTKFGIFENSDQIQYFLNFKFRPKLRFFMQISNKMAIYRKFRPKSRFSENFDQNRDFLKISTIIEIFRKFRPK